jgi:hypothetical protein
VLLQRLHPNHEQPKNVYSKYDRGWVIYIKQAQGGGNPSLASQQFMQFLDACNNPLNRLAGLSSVASTPGWPLGITAGYPQTYPVTNPVAAGATGGVGGGGHAHASLVPTLRLMDPQSPQSQSHPPQQQQQQLSQRVSRLSLDRNATAAVAGGGAGQPGQQQQQFQHRYSGSSMLVAAAPPSPAAANSPGPAPAAPGGPGGQSGVGVAAAAAGNLSSLYPWMNGGLQRSDSSGGGSARIGTGVGRLSRSSGHDQVQQAPDGPLLYAEPGETDEDFARRLHSYYSSSTDQNPFVSPPSSRGNSASAANGGSPMRAGDNGGRVGSGGGRPEGAAAAALTAAATAAASAASGSPNNPFLGMPGVVPAGGFVSTPATSTAVPAAVPAGRLSIAASEGQQLPSAPPLTGSAPAAATPGGGGGSIGVSPAMSPGVTAGPTGGSSGLGEDPQEADMCVICLSASREVGFLHGSSVHKCVCKECAGLVQVNAPCPMCRQPIERVLGVY